MSRLSWSSLALIALLFLGACSSLGILQDSAEMTTPARPSQQKGVMDADAARRAAAAQKAKQLKAQQQASAAAQQQPTTILKNAAPTKVALLAPLSGKSAALGQSMVNAAQLAVFDMGVNQFELMPRDTKGTTEGAVAAAKDSLASGAQLIVGPLFAADVAAVKPVVREANVSMLALSTDVSLAEPGSYVMGFAPAPQVRRVVSYAYDQGVRQFAAAIPHGPYGQLVEKAFRQAVQEKGGTVVAVEPVSNIAALAAQKDKIEAIFLPLGGNDLRAAAIKLASAGFDRGRVRILGTGLWDEPNLAQGGADLLLGGWFAAPEPSLREKFMQSYQETYSQPAPRLSTLAYDATALAAILSHNVGRFDRAALSNPAGFAGLDGIFRLLPDGQIERGLAVLEVGPATSVIADPAPGSFGK